VLVLVLASTRWPSRTLLRVPDARQGAMGLRVVRDDGGPIGFRQAPRSGAWPGFLERPGPSLYPAGHRGPWL
jgi:hypothetical protein